MYYSAGAHDCATKTSERHQLVPAFAIITFRESRRLPVSKTVPAKTVLSVWMKVILVITNSQEKKCTCAEVFFQLQAFCFLPCLPFSWDFSLYLHPTSLWRPPVNCAPSDHTPVGHGRLQVPQMGTHIHSSDSAEGLSSLFYLALSTTPLWYHRPYFQTRRLWLTGTVSLFHQAVPILADWLGHPCSVLWA